MQHLQNPFYNESDTSAADQIEWVGPIANIFFPDDNNETLHKHSLTEHSLTLLLHSLHLVTCSKWVVDPLAGKAENKFVLLSQQLKLSTCH